MAPLAAAAALASGHLLVIGRGRSRRGPRADGTTLLVDHWYSHAVGHVIEALRRCQGYHACDPELHVSLVLNGASPVELARCAPFVAEVFDVPYTSFGKREGSARRALRGVPRDWDYVVHHHAAEEVDQQRFDGLRHYYDTATEYFRARRAVGIAGREPPAYAQHQQLRLALPADARARALAALGGRRSIAVMPAGSSSLRALYPSVTSWNRLLGELERRDPETLFTFVGRLSPDGGRTTTGITREELGRLLAARGQATDAFDLPLLDQLALVEAAGLFLSPHTGFGFAAVAVGTPWLVLSGGDWHEHFFNGVPFYSVLPKGGFHPAFVRGRALPMIDADSDGEGARTTTMSVARVEEDLDEIVDAARRLIEGRLSFEEALAIYFPALLEAYGGDGSLISTFDEIHVGRI